jgi:hypothetical protein
MLSNNVATFKVANWYPALIDYAVIFSRVLQA